MILKDKIGKLVLNKKNEQGTIVEVRDYIKVDFGNRTAQFQLDAFINGFLKFVDAKLQLEVDNAIKEAKIEKARIAEERRIAAEKAVEERAKDELLNQRKKYPKKIWYLDLRFVMAEQKIIPIGLRRLALIMLENII